MPRKKIRFEEPPRAVGGGLAERLAEELRADRASGQPVILEQEFPNGNLRVTVIWDEWDQQPLESRSSIILRAYELAEGRGQRDKIALASGLTIPEAHAAGMLPFQIIPALREGDAVTADECHQAMIAEGASVLLDPRKPQLRFASEAEAHAARERLQERLLNSRPVWVINEEAGRVEDWAQT
jgi:hypothetical protein